MHRDIKPHNILQVDGVWKVADLGFAKDLKRVDAALTRTGMRLGTEVYMSPEHRSGDTKSLNERSDIYQLGLVLFQMVTGDIPIHPDPSDISDDEVRRIYVKCVKSKQENRYGRVTDLMADVRDLTNAYSAGSAEGPDPSSWLDSPSFSNSCRKEIRRYYIEVRASDRWGDVLDAVSKHWMHIFSALDQMFRDGTIPPGCKAGKGVRGLVSDFKVSHLARFSESEKKVVAWLVLRRVVFAAVVKYPRLARRDIDALLVLFLNYIEPSARTTEFLRQRGWRSHVVRMRPYLSKYGIKPKGLSGGMNAVSTLGEHEREWLTSLDTSTTSLPIWWIDGGEEADGEDGEEAYEMDDDDEDEEDGEEEDGAQRPRNEPAKCSVRGCPHLADFEVFLYDRYSTGAEFLEQDYTCPFLCRAHAEENEWRAHGRRVARGNVRYEYSNRHGAQGYTKYKQISKARLHNLTIDPSLILEMTRSSQDDAT
ncbi:protein kinase [Nannocystis pusilla]|uniref:Protein kinase n=1 Tax=Nannocystis pusilla TaxID=889268 RepID=A0A9X3EU40_9BACT|nr:protein kinase [Nannocystis pusilla]